MPSLPTRLWQARDDLRRPVLKQRTLIDAGAHCLLANAIVGRYRWVVSVRLYAGSFAGGDFGPLTLRRQNHMRKLAIGLVVAAGLAVAGYFGAGAYAQHRAAEEVAAAFAAMRGAGGSATHGTVSFDLWNRTLVVSDIALASAGEPKTTLKIARMTANGLSRPEGGRFAARHIEFSDLSAAYAPTMPVAMTIAYTVPRLMVEEVSAPIAPLRPLDATSLTDAWRFGLEHVAAINLASLTIPTMTMTVEPAPGERPSPVGTAHYDYKGITLRDLQAGRLASSTIDRMTTTSTIAGAGAKPVSFTIEAADIAAHDFDANAILPLLDRAQAKDDTYHRVYRRITAGAYTARFDQAGPGGSETVQFATTGMAIDEIGVKPSKIQIEDLLTLASAIQPTGTQPSPTAVKAALEQFARIYEGTRVGRFEISGLTVTIPDQAVVKLASTQLNDLTDGRIGEIAIEGLDVAAAPRPPVKLGRLAFKSFGIADLMRTAADLQALGADAGRERALALLRLLGGVEIHNLVAPYKATDETVTVEVLKASWGQFVGLVPTAARVTAKMSSPLAASKEPVFTQLAASAGMTSVVMALDVGAAWDEQAATLALTPATIEIDGLLGISARAGLGKVSRDVFALDPARQGLALMASQVAPIEIVIRDLGGKDMLLQIVAAQHNMSLEEMRKEFIDDLQHDATELAAVNPDVPAALAAISDFIASPRGTLTLRLTPTGNINPFLLAASIELQDPSVLGQMRIEAITTH